MTSSVGRKKAAAMAKRQRSDLGIKISVCVKQCLELSSCCIILQKPDIDLNDPTAVEEFLMTEMTLANQELMQGRSNIFCNNHYTFNHQGMCVVVSVIWSTLLYTRETLRML